MPSDVYTTPCRTAYVTASTREWTPSFMKVDWM